MAIISSRAPVWFSAEDVLKNLDQDASLSVVREAMIDHSSGATRHLLRSFIGLGEGRTFAIMPGALAIDGYFGAKLVSVFADPSTPGRRAHRGVVVLFDGDTGAPAAFADAEAITQVRTAAASAVATDALARADVKTLAILGSGRQAAAHIRALVRVRSFEKALIWGRSPLRVGELIASLSDIPGVALAVAPDPRTAVEQADVVCTVTSAREPILKGAWMRPGLHVNLVGSSGPGPREADTEAVARARFFADCREHVTNHGAEFLRAVEDGAIKADHIVAEIGEVLSGAAKGRITPDDVTIYKSLGHAVQDLASLRYLYELKLTKASQT